MDTLAAPRSNYHGRIHYHYTPDGEPRHANDYKTQHGLSH